MLTFAPNLTTLFTDVPFLERFEKAKKAGFTHVEFQFPYAFSIDEIIEQLTQHELQTVLFNLPAGNWEKGDRGISIFPERRDEFKQSVITAMTYARALRCSTLHCMAGVKPNDLDVNDALHIYKENLSFCAKEFEQHDLTVVIEPINTFDIPNYFLSNLQLAVDILNDLSLPNVKLQYDVYHMQRMQGELIASYKKYKDIIAHVQIADNPGRHEPGTGEIHYENVFRALMEEGYNGFIGLEYNPQGQTEESFTWL
ncbi:hydroxypyruvate isomerase family protein [Pueribacillus sp. YX66]|uniref:hydroxypyruvate isomerase family protein n=1 Tax=Pueribacillus sp. YX66 TaxID=3229242 RepID=UPI00358CECF0